MKGDDFMKHFVRFYSNINGKGKDVYRVNGKTVSEEEFESYLNLMEKEYECSCNEKCEGCNCHDKKEEVKENDKAQSELDYYTSEQFNIFETVEFLEKFSEWKAQHNGITYKLNEDGQLVIDNEYLAGVTVTIKSLKWMFNLIPPEEREEWIDVNIQNQTELFKYIIDMLDKDYMMKEKYKITDAETGYKSIEEYTYQSIENLLNNIEFSELTSSEWQYLKKEN